MEDDDQIQSGQVDPSQTVSKIKKQMQDKANSVIPLLHLKESLKYGKMMGTTPPVMRVSFTPDLGKGDSKADLKAELYLLLKNHVQAILPEMISKVKDHVAADLASIEEIANSACESTGSENIRANIKDACKEVLGDFKLEIDMFAQSLCTKTRKRRASSPTLGKPNHEPRNKRDRLTTKGKYRGQQGKSKSRK